MGGTYLAVAKKTHEILAKAESLKAGSSVIVDITEECELPSTSSDEDIDIGHPEHVPGDNRAGPEEHRDEEDSAMSPTVSEALRRIPDL